MILGDTHIKDLISTVNLIDAEKSTNDAVYVGPSSLDLHLDNKAKILRKPSHGWLVDPIHITDPALIGRFDEYNGWDDITIFPGEFYILHTKEYLRFPKDLAGFIQGRSSLARLGINIHAAGFFDPGFEGTATLEVTNFTSVPIIIPQNTRIAQMVFMRAEGVDIDYSQKKDHKYLGQNEPQLTRVFDDHERTQD